MVLLGKVALGIVGTAVAGVGVLCSEGMIEVKVVERQPEVHHVYVIAPAMLVPIGMHFAPRGEFHARQPRFNRGCLLFARHWISCAKATT